MIFDLAYPSHYMRRIKSVSLTIPCVTGPYTNVSVKLTLLSNRLRVNTSTNGGYAYQGLQVEEENNRFRNNLIGI